MKETLKFLLKVAILLGLALGLTTVTSCDDDCTSTYDVYEYVGDSRSTDATALIILEDTCMESITDYSVIQIRNNATLTLLGDDVNVQASVTFTDGGTLNVEKSLIISNDIFFLGDGATVNVGLGLVVGHAVDQGNFGGEINYCVFSSIQILDPGVISTQNCNITFESCETLSDTSIQGYRYLGRLDYKCNMKDTPEFKYVELY